MTCRRRPGLSSGSRIACLVLICLSLAATASRRSSAQAQNLDENWIRLTGTDGGLFGINGGVAQHAAIDDNGNVFTVIWEFVGNAGVARIARWDGANWIVLSAYVDVPSSFGVHSICVDPAGTSVFVGGNFAVGGDGSGVVGLLNAARLDVANDAWDTSFPGLNGRVIDCGVDAGGNFYAVGQFATDFGGNPFPGLARWDVNSNTWATIGAGAAAGTGTGVSSMFVEADGSVTLARNPVERFDSATGMWSNVGTDFDAGSAVLFVAVDGTTVYAGGSLARASTSDQVFKWDGAQWSRYGSIPGQFFPRSMEIDGMGTLYAIPEVSAGQVLARESTATSWTTIGTSNFEILQRLATNARRLVDDVHLIGVFGSITDASSTVVPAVKQARWDGTGWSGLLPQGSGTIGTVRVVAPVGHRFGTDRYLHALVVGGEVTKVNHVSVNRIAISDGTNWRGMGLGVTDPNGTVRAAVGVQKPSNPYTFDIYVGGRFNEVMNSDGTPVPTSNIAVWDLHTKSWASVGRGVSVGGIPATGIVNAVEVWREASVARETYVYVGGSFDTATNADGSSIAVNNIARFNVQTGQWESVLGGVDGVVHALEVSQLFHDEVGGSSYGHTLFVGGEFTQARDVSLSPVADTPNVVRLTSRNEWAAVGRGTNGPVYALRYRSRSYAYEPSLAGILYAGGDFTNVTDGVGPIRPAANIAKWYSGYDRWDVFGPSPLDNGVNGIVRTIEFHEADSGPVANSKQTLIVGGDFTAAWNDGGQVAARHAVFLVDDYPTAPFLGGHPSWARETFKPFGGGLDDIVRDVTARTCTASNEILFGGDFMTAGLNPVRTSPMLIKYEAGRVYAAPEWKAVGGAGCKGKCQVSVAEMAPRCAGGFLSKTAEVTIPPVGFGEVVVIDSDRLHPDVPFRFTITDSTGAQHVIENVVVGLDGSATLMLSGVSDTTQFAVNPDGKSTRFAVTPVQVTSGGSSTEPLVRFANTVTDAPAVDVVLSDGSFVADSIGFGDASVPDRLAAGSYAAEIRRHDDGTVLATIGFEVTSSSDAQVIALAGFVDPAANQNGPSLALVPVVTGTPTGIGRDELPVNESAGVRLEQPYPNPFQTMTHIGYAVAVPTEARLEVFDVLGRRVAVLFDGVVPAGEHVATWDAAGATSGLYFVRLQLGGQADARAVTLVR